MVTGGGVFMETSVLAGNLALLGTNSDNLLKYDFTYLLNDKNDYVHSSFRKCRLGTATVRTTNSPLGSSLFALGPALLLFLNFHIYPLRLRVYEALNNGIVCFRLSYLVVCMASKRFHLLNKCVFCWHYYSSTISCGTTG